MPRKLRQLRADLRAWGFILKRTEGSHGIHGGSRGTKLNVKEQRSNIRMISGPSNADLAEPAHTSLLSLQYCTLALLDMRPEFLSLDSVATVKALIRLVEEAGTTFTEIEEALDREEAEIAAGSTRDALGQTGSALS